MRKTPPKTLKRLLVMLLGTALLAATLAVQAGETVTYVQTDIQGNPVTKTDSSGKVIWRQSYAPYGRTYQQTDPDGPGYTGHRHDAATGLVYMQARYYDPKIGRFLSPDPVTFSPEQPDHFNLYWYANGNPIRYTDPDGRDTTGEWIDENAQAAANSGNHVATYGWAFAGTTWRLLGNESLSQVADKGSAASTSDKVMAIISVVTLGKGSEAETVGKGVVEGTEDVAKGVAIRLENTAKEAAKAQFRKESEGMTTKVIRDRGTGKVVGVGTNTRKGPTYRPKGDGSYSVGRPKQIKHYRPDKEGGYTVNNQ